ncbi:hypothetical protein SAMN05660831_00262 [Thiohalospira halophila DSM 15071]|uniref:Uncharacterized protein n=1 Tax=Thiohalospira halophila DSM 15071 TaxID=1123397 RepID=A0A1I1NGG6_9GAMM|nr:hypothetical protein SAMN05660831_00262 [Thiohalospira halophila DSM 15071]
MKMFQALVLSGHEVLLFAPDKTYGRETGSTVKGQKLVKRLLNGVSRRNRERLSESIVRAFFHVS